MSGRVETAPSVFSLSFDDQEDPLDFSNILQNTVECRLDDLLASLDLAEGSRLGFESEAERAHDENFLLIRSRYSHRFGRFSGSLGNLDLAEGFGVMERHEALW